MLTTKASCIHTKKREIHWRIQVWFKSFQQKRSFCVIMPLNLLTQDHLRLRVPTNILRHSCPQILCYSWSLTGVNSYISVVKTASLSITWTEKSTQMSELSSSQEPRESWMIKFRFSEMKLRYPWTAMLGDNTFTWCG